MTSHNDMDALYLGNIISSFNGSYLFPVPNEISNQPSVIIAFALQDNSLSIIKMTLKMVSTFLNELTQACEKFNIKNHRDDFIKSMILNNFDCTIIDNDDNFRIIDYLKNRPDMRKMPESIFVAESHQYAKFIHLNAYKEAFKLDITFHNETTTRYTLPSSLVVLFIELLQHFKGV